MLPFSSSSSSSKALLDDVIIAPNFETLFTLVEGWIKGEEFYRKSTAAEKR